MISDIIK